jgi:hypothetical protein
MIERRRLELGTMDKDELINSVINRELNHFIASHDEFKDDEVDPHGHGKRVPYIGWYWRNVDFATGKYIPIGDCGEFIGFMENNKWGYASRILTPDEVEKVTKIVCKAYDLSQAGGILSDIITKTNKELDKLWPLLQSFPIKREGYWISGSLQGRVGFEETEEGAKKMCELLESAAPGIKYTYEKA